MTRPTRRRGRPPETDARRLELSALRLFATQGFEQTTIEQIAAGVGVSKRTFFRYFDSKAAVLWHAFDSEVDAIRAGLADAPADLPILTAIRHGVLAANNHHRAEALPELRLRISLLRAVPELTASATQHYDVWAGVVADFVAERTGRPADSLFPLAIGRATLATCRTAYDRWAERSAPDFGQLSRADSTLRPTANLALQPTTNLAPRPATDLTPRPTTDCNQRSATDLVTYLDLALRGLEAGFADAAIVVPGFRRR